MALRDQPYLPLYIKDIMTDEKLNNCSAATHGIYIKGLMCLMHKSEEYGKILLNQKFRQTDKQSKNFANMLVKHLPYTVDEIEQAIDELIEEKVCYYEDQYICQKRMVKDGRISDLRSDVGKKGNKKAQENKDALQNILHQQTSRQNTANEYANEYEVVNKDLIVNSNLVSKDINADFEKKSDKVFYAFRDQVLENDLQSLIDEFKGAHVGRSGIERALNDYCLNLETMDETKLPRKYTIFRQWFKDFLKLHKSEYESKSKITITHLDEDFTKEDLHGMFQFYWTNELTLGYIREQIFEGAFPPRQENPQYKISVNNGLIILGEE